MKILHCIPTYAPAWEFGGPVRSVSQLCEALAVLGHQVTVLTTSAGLAGCADITPGSGPMERNGVQVTYHRVEPGLGIRSGALVQGVRTRAREFDVAHVTGVWQRTSPGICAALRASGVPYVVSPRGALGPYSWRRKWLKKTVYYWLYERANLIHATGAHFTSSMEQQECARFPLPRLQCVVPNGIDLTRWRRDESAGQAWRRENAIDDEVFTIVNTGRLHHKKGLELLPEALAPLSDATWRVVFVGPDDDGTGGRLRNAFAGQGLDDRVLFLPTCAQAALCAAYSAADLFVLPSRHENFGNVILEALACGCPVAVSDRVGIAADLAGADGVRVLPHIPRLWTDALRERLALGRTSKPEFDRLKAGFDVHDAASSMATFYEAVIQESP